MSRRHGMSCKRCGALARSGVAISARNLCEPCGRLALEENNAQLQAHSGPLFEWWRVRCLQAFGVNLAQLAVAVDGPPDDAQS